MLPKLANKNMQMSSFRYTKRLNNHLYHHSHKRQYHYIIPVFHLQEYCPTDAIQNFLHSCYDTMSIPYALAMISIPIINKLFIRFPLDSLTTKYLEINNHKLPEMKIEKFYCTQTILNSKDNTPTPIFREWLDITSEQWKQRFIYFVPNWASFYVHLSAYIAIESMVFHGPCNHTFLWMYNGLSSVDPTGIMPIANGIGFIAVYAWINRFKAPNFKRRRRNFFSSLLLYIPVSAVFFSSAFQIYILSNLMVTVLYRNYLFDNEKFQNRFGLMSNENRFDANNEEGIVDVYTKLNKNIWKHRSIHVFNESFREDDNTFSKNWQDLYEAEQLYTSVMPKKDEFRNLELSESEYDEFKNVIHDSVQPDLPSLELTDDDCLLLDDDENEQESYIPK